MHVKNQKIAFQSVFAHEKMRRLRFIFLRVGLHLLLPVIIDLFRWSVLVGIDAKLHFWGDDQRPPHSVDAKQIDQNRGHM